MLLLLQLLTFETGVDVWDGPNRWDAIRENCVGTFYRVFHVVFDQHLRVVQSLSMVGFYGTPQHVQHVETSYANCW